MGNNLFQSKRSNLNPSAVPAWRSGINMRVLLLAVLMAALVISAAFSPLAPGLQQGRAASLMLAPTATPADAKAPPIIGGADKIAWIAQSDIWTANLDGSELTRLTQNDGLKTNLRWLPGGQGLSFIKGKCIHTISLQGDDQVVACFNNAKYLDAFEVSPDGSQVVIGLDNQLYLLPFDLAALKNAKKHSDLEKMAVCTGLGPYKRNYGRTMRWSQDGTSWAALVLGVLKNGRRGDLIQVFPVDKCIPNPIVKAQFPEPHFTTPAYNAYPTIKNFSWDGDSLFVLNDHVRNGGFGHLHIFNMENFLPELTIDPIDEVCCYRDAAWSPDGSHLVFAFQNYRQGSKSTTQLYLILYGDVGTGTAFTPLPLPVITNPKESPQPVLRPAVTP